MTAVSIHSRGQVGLFSRGASGRQKHSASKASWTGHHASRIFQYWSGANLPTELHSSQFLAGACGWPSGTEVLSSSRTASYCPSSSFGGTISGHPCGDHTRNPC